LGGNGPSSASPLAPRRRRILSALRCARQCDASDWDAYFNARHRRHRDSGAPAPVDQYSTNPWGLYQVHGNVLEWCEDGYPPHQLEELERDNDPTLILQWSYRYNKSARGGTYNCASQIDHTRCAFRSMLQSVQTGYAIGLRVARDLQF